MEPLSDPIKDRQVKNLKPPPHKPLDKALLWPEKLKSTSRELLAIFTKIIKKDKPDWKLLRTHLQKEGRIYKDDLIRIVNETNKLLSF